MQEALYIVVAIVDLLVISYRIWLLFRAGGDPAMFWYCIGVSLGVPYVLLRLPDVHTALGQLVGVTNVAHPIAISIVVIACFLLRPLLRGLELSSERTTPTRRTFLTLVVAVACVGVSFDLV